MSGAATDLRSLLPVDDARSESHLLECGAAAVRDLAPVLQQSRPGFRLHLGLLASALLACLLGAAVAVQRASPSSSPVLAGGGGPSAGAPPAFASKIAFGPPEAGQSGAWLLISASKACERNREGIVRTAGEGGHESLESCQGACGEGCAAIDYEAKSGRCNLFGAPCDTPLSTGDGWVSYKKGVPLSLPRDLAIETEPAPSPPEASTPAPTPAPAPVSSVSLDGDEATLLIRESRNEFLDGRYTAEDVVRAWFGFAGTPQWRELQSGEKPGEDVGDDVTAKVKHLLARGDVVRATADDLGAEHALAGQHGSTKMLTSDAAFWQQQAWQCYNYEHEQDDAWCESAGVLQGFEYKFARGDGACGPCWCCRRRAQAVLPARHGGVLLVKVRRGKVTESKPERVCYKMVAGIPNVVLKEPGMQVGLTQVGTVSDCNRACSGLAECRNFMSCGELKRCTFFDKVVSLSEDPEVVFKGHGCQHYVEAPCEVAALTLGKTKGTVRVSGEDSFFAGVFGADNIAKATLESGKDDEDAKDVTAAVRGVAFAGKSAVPKDLGNGGDKTLQVEFYQDPGFMHWLPPAGSLPWENAWACHTYENDDQNDNWCETVDTVEGHEYKLARGDGTCGKCWCCRRKVVPHVPRAYPAKVDIFFGDTRRADGVYAVPGVPGKYFTNVGAGFSWHSGYAAKLDFFKRLLKYWTAKDPEKILIIMDSDVGYGGCSDEELLARYHKVVEAAGGASVVSGADPWQNPPVPGLEARTLKLLPRRDAILKAFGLAPDAWKAYAPQWPRTPTGDYVFLNSGFLMGPAKDLQWVYDCGDRKGWRFDDPRGRGPYWDDQRGISLCMVDHPSRITLDYSGSIVTTLFGMQGDLFGVRGQTVHNRLANTTQCFMHTDCAMCKAAFLWPDWLKWLTRRFRSVSAPRQRD